ncbi:MAG: hypothetical protein NVSMB57_08290 [Actinomycetota bacterium]
MYKNQPADDRHGQQRIHPGVADGVIEGLREVVERGTGRVAQLSGCSVWAKTGTTEDHADAWFVGGGCGIVTAVWVGYPKGRVPMTDVHGIQVVGSSFPAQIWKRVMQAMLDKYRPVDDKPIQKQITRHRTRARHQTEEPAPEQAIPTEAPPPEPTPQPSNCLLILCR